MKTREEFKQIISKSFIDHIRKESFLPLEGPINREEYCDKVYEEILQNTYHPSLPRENIIARKHGGAVRLIPVFTLKDSVVYYFCVKSLEDYLAEGYVDCTFGGFRLSGKIKTLEDSELNGINEIPFSSSPFSFNPTAWTEAWQEFQKRAYQISREETSKYFIFLDIANFYCTIDLALLERKVRSKSPDALSFEIDLLFYFLKYWDRSSYYFAPKSIGIPMSDFGEGSRLLANFFLQDYDKRVRDYCLSKNAKYLRYSDDQIIVAPNKNAAEEILRFASIELSKIGLNVNSGKIQHFSTREEFEEHWAFEIFQKLSTENETLVKEAVNHYLNHPSKKNIRWPSILKKIINCNFNYLSIEEKSKIFSEIFDKEFIVSCDHRYLHKIYRLLETDSDKSKYISFLKSITEDHIYTDFHYYLLLAKKKGLPIDFEGLISERIVALKHPKA